MSEIHAEPATGEAAEDKSLGELVALVSRDISHLVRSEIDLAKVEITADVKRTGMAGGMFGGAGFLGYFALFFLSVTAALAIGLVLPLVIGFLIVGGAYLLLAVILALVGVSNLRKLEKARRTKKTVQDTMTLVKGDKGGAPQPQG